MKTPHTCTCKNPIMCVCSLSLTLPRYLGKKEYPKLLLSLDLNFLLVSLKTFMPSELKISHISSQKLLYTSLLAPRGLFV